MTSPRTDTYSLGRVRGNLAARCESIAPDYHRGSARVTRRVVMARGHRWEGQGHGQGLGLKVKVMVRGRARTAAPRQINASDLANRKIIG